jgi:hypothetical protein
MRVKSGATGVRLTICIAILTVLSGLQATARAQTRRLVYADSIVMIGDPRDTLSVAYVFPRRIAIEYLNLRSSILPAKNELIAGLEQTLRLRDLTIQARDTIITNREAQAGLLRGALAKSDSVIVERERELANSIRRERLYRKLFLFGLPIGVGAGVIAGLLIN